MNLLIWRLSVRKICKVWKISLKLTTLRKLKPSKETICQALTGLKPKTTDWRNIWKPAAEKLRIWMLKIWNRKPILKKLFLSWRKKMKVFDWRCLRVNAIVNVKLIGSRWNSIKCMRLKLAIWRSTIKSIYSACRERSQSWKESSQTKMMKFSSWSKRKPPSDKCSILNLAALRNKFNLFSTGSRTLKAKSLKTNKNIKRNLKIRMITLSILISSIVTKEKPTISNNKPLGKSSNTIKLSLTKRGWQTEKKNRLWRSHLLSTKTKLKIWEIKSEERRQQRIALCRS